MNHIKRPPTINPTQESSPLSFYSSAEIEKIARREYQDAPLKQTMGKNPRWYIRIRKRMIGPNGVERKQTREYLGRCNEVGIRQAQQERQKKLAEINGQIYSMPSKILFREFAIIYRDKHLPTVGQGTQDKYWCLLTNWLMPTFWNDRLCDITTERIQELLNDCEQRGLSWSSRTTLRNTLSGVFTKADHWGYWRERNPVERTTCGRKRFKREKRILSVADTLLLLEELPSQCAMVAKMAAYTGMRISEILGLKWKNLDLQRGLVFVRERQCRGDQDITKTESSNRELPLGDFVVELAATLPPDHLSETFVFSTSTGSALGYDNLRSRELVPTAKRLGLYFEGFGFHSLRRGFLTAIQEMGGSSIEAQKLAGHSRPSMTSEYTFVTRKRHDELVSAVQRHINTHTVEPPSSASGLPLPVQ